MRQSDMTETVRAGRECKRCGEDRADFMKPDAKSVDGHMMVCRQCHSDYVAKSNRRKRVDHPGVEAAYQAARIAARPGERAARRAANIERERLNQRAHESRRRARKQECPASREADDMVVLLASTPCDCFYCGKEMPGAEQVDHFYPLARGGAHHPANLVPACQKCNQRKSAKDPFDFLREMAGRMALVISE